MIQFAEVELKLLEVRKEAEAVRDVPLLLKAEQAEKAATAMVEYQELLLEYLAVNLLKES